MSKNGFLKIYGKCGEHNGGPVSCQLPPLCGARNSFISGPGRFFEKETRMNETVEVSEKVRVFSIISSLVEKGGPEASKIARLYIWQDFVRSIYYGVILVLATSVVMYGIYKCVLFTYR